MMSIAVYILKDVYDDLCVVCKAFRSETPTFPSTPNISSFHQRKFKNILQIFTISTIYEPNEPSWWEWRYNIILHVLIVMCWLLISQILFGSSDKFYLSGWFSLFEKIQWDKFIIEQANNQIKFEISATNFFLINLRTINSESTQIYNFSSLNLCLFGISEK